MQRQGNQLIIIHSAMWSSCKNQMDPKYRAKCNIFCHCREENQQKHDIWGTLVTLMTSGTHSCGATLVWLQPGQRRNP